MTKSLKAFRMGILIGMVFALSACESLKESRSNNIYRTQLSKRNPSHKQLWTRLQDNFQLASNAQSHENRATHVDKHVERFSRNEKALQQISTQATPYLYYIVDELEKRGMPGELALLPIVESAYIPHATSQQGASGLWQFMSSTATHYGLHQDAIYDGRLDVKASTDAALDHLHSLYHQFDQDWLLTLAAYNAGEGRVQRAIKRNQKSGKPVTFWDLPLPKETREYIPKLLALAKIIGAPEQHNVVLPHIANTPYFEMVDPGTHIDFKKVAQLAGVNIRELKKLNPGYRNAHTHPTGPQVILLPVKNVKTFQCNLNQTAQGVL